MKKYSTCTRSCSCTLYRCTFVPSYNVVHLFGGNRFANGDMIASGVLQRTVRVHVHVCSRRSHQPQRSHRGVAYCVRGLPVEKFVRTSYSRSHVLPGWVRAQS
jgi:hypothetical protein